MASCPWFRRRFSIPERTCRRGQVEVVNAAGSGVVMPVDKNRAVDYFTAGAWQQCRALIH
jgi:hypothetical protein